MGTKELTEGLRIIFKEEESAENPAIEAKERDVPKSVKKQARAIEKAKFKFKARKGGVKTKSGLAYAIAWKHDAKLHPNSKHHKHEAAEQPKRKRAQAVILPPDPGSLDAAAKGKEPSAKYLHHAQNAEKLSHRANQTNDPIHHHWAKKAQELAGEHATHDSTVKSHHYAQATEHGKRAGLKAAR